jgi:hypothetical protein
MRTWLSLSAVYQVPTGSAANAGIITLAEKQSAAVAKRNVVIAGLDRSMR